MAQRLQQSNQENRENETMIENALVQKPYYVRANHFDSERMAGTVSVWKNNSGNDVEASAQSSASSLIPNNESTNPTKAPTASFSEFLDIVNPLHHLPVVGSVYRSITGDEISSVAKIAGGAIYGGPLGGLSSIAQAAVEEHSGDTLVNSIRNAASAEPVSAYHFHDERTAGLRQNDHQAQTAKATSTTDVEEAIQVSQAQTKEISMDGINWGTREPITPVTIELAKANINDERPKQKWNLNG